KLALGHHSDDVVQTMLLSLLYEGRFSTFQPISYMDRTKITLIRPFIYVSEVDISGITKNLNLPVVHNPCPANKHTQREYINKLISEIEADVPFAKERMLGAICHPERNNLWGEKSD
ncbi:MAG: ATP-binding protein, partial [Clostridia bacterium]